MEYNIAKGSKLKLKGEKKAHKKKKRKHVEDTESSEYIQLQKKIEEDTQKHGGWWSATPSDLFSGTVAVEFENQTYMKALDDGTFTLGAPHDEGDPPAPEEIFTAIRINEDKIALKSGYDKYLKVDKDGNVVGRSDAVSSLEQWEPVFEDGKMALQSNSGCFMSINLEDDSVIATAKKAGPSEIVQMRCFTERASKSDELPAEEKGNIKQIEINYVKKFQKFQDKRMRLCEEDRDAIKKARDDGTLHEALLDRRSKMKADRYCK